jgi:hypothetical protein
MAIREIMRKEIETDRTRITERMRERTTTRTTTTIIEIGPILPSPEEVAEMERWVEEVRSMMLGRTRGNGG